MYKWGIVLGIDNIIDLNFEDDRPFTKELAWIYLKSQASPLDRKINVSGVDHYINTGEVVINIANLRDKWRWRHKAVKAFLYELEFKYSLITKVSFIKKSSKYKNCRKDDLYIISINNAPNFIDISKKLGITEKNNHHLKSHCVNCGKLCVKHVDNYSNSSVNVDNFSIVDNSSKSEVNSMKNGIYRKKQILVDGIDRHGIIKTVQVEPDVCKDSVNNRCLSVSNIYKKTDKTKQDINTSMFSDKNKKEKTDITKPIGNSHSLTVENKQYKSSGELRVIDKPSSFVVYVDGNECSDTCLYRCMAPISAGSPFYDIDDGVYVSLLNRYGRVTVIEAIEALTEQYSDKPILNPSGLLSMALDNKWDLSRSIKKIKFRKGKMELDRHNNFYMARIYSNNFDNALNAIDRLNYYPFKGKEEPVRRNGLFLMYIEQNALNVYEKITSHIYTRFYRTGSDHLYGDNSRNVQVFFNVMFFVEKICRSYSKSHFELIDALYKSGGDIELVANIIYYQIIEDDFLNNILSVKDEVDVLNVA